MMIMFQIKLWYIPDEGVRTHVNHLKELPAHSRRVAYIEWHPTASDILASAGLDARVGGCGTSWVDEINI